MRPAVQEVITLSVFVPFAMVYLREPLKDDLWAALCLCGAAYFMFRGMLAEPPGWRS